MNTTSETSISVPNQQGQTMTKQNPIISEKAKLQTTESERRAPLVHNYTHKHAQIQTVTDTNDFQNPKLTTTAPLTPTADRPFLGNEQTERPMTATARRPAPPAAFFAARQHGPRNKNTTAGDEMIRNCYLRSRRDSW